jgi:hypothetical protein
MARTKLAIKEVRNLTKLVRAIAAYGKLADLDDYLDGIQTSYYAAAGAISPQDGLAVLTANAPAQAMTLAAGSVVGETLNVILREKTATGTAVITGTFTGGTTLTLSAVGQRATLIWVGAAWTPRPGFGGVLA